MIRRRFLQAAGMAAVLRAVPASGAGRTVIDAAGRRVALPALGRLTGRGNTANVEVVLAARPDVIVDYGALGPTSVSLADRAPVSPEGAPHGGAFDISCWT